MGCAQPEPEGQTECGAEKLPSQGQTQRCLAGRRKTDRCVDEPKQRLSSVNRQ